MNSFIGWIGGKRALRKEIIDRFPKDIDRYIEVFGGAGWVLFGKEKVTGQLEVYNDLDGNLVNLFRCVKYHCGELQRELQWMLSSREQFKICANQMDVKGLTDIQRAARFFFLVKSSFGTNRRSYKTNTSNLAHASESLLAVSQRLAGVVIENQDFEHLIKTYDRPKALLYVDPPYRGSEKLYDVSFNDADHIRLNHVLEGVKSRFIVSYNDDPLIRDLYSKYKIVPVIRKENLSQNGKAYQELIISNF